jgi:hypothetical protein
MTFPLEYHKTVRPSIQASRALFGTVLLLLLLVSTSRAQINGIPPSVTSPGFGGHAINGTPPSVTSLGRNGYAPPVTFSTNHPGNASRHLHPTAQGDAYYGYVYAMPYAVDVRPTGNDADADDDSEYQGGPTVFDRRGSGAASYVPPSSGAPAHAHPQVQPAQDPSESPQITTTLVFRDGHQVEIENYAIVTQTLYDLTPGHPRKIALADLDLPATEKQNDDRGVTFQLPPSAQVN